MYSISGYGPQFLRGCPSARPTTNTAKYCLRTTVDVPDPVYRGLKTKVAQRGCAVNELVLRTRAARVLMPRDRKAVLACVVSPP
jgi:hypothetical protein